MSRISVFLALIIGVILVDAAGAFAWDGKRKGFILGIGGGGGLASFKPYSDFGEGEHRNKFAIMTDSKIGYAPSNQVAVQYSSKVAWFRQDFGDGKFEPSNTVTIVNGIVVLGVTYYFQPDGPSPYLTGGVGFSTWGTPFEADYESLFGSGFALGAGYEFSKHWSIEGNFTWGSPDRVDNQGSFGMKTLGVKFTINVLGY